MGWKHELAHSAGVNTCHPHDCVNLVPVLLTWHSTLYNLHGSKYDLGRVKKGIGLNIRHLSQLPLNVSLVVGHIDRAATLH
jgi:hypothetical protein